MITQDYISAVNGMNYLRVRIMLKDSLLVDPTFLQFDEMVKYADRVMPDLWLEDDGDTFQNDQRTWTHQLMNQELVEVVNSFTKRRIQHIKDVISVLYADEIKKTKTQRIQMANQTRKEAPSNANTGRNAYYEIRKGSKHIEEELSRIQREGKRSKQDVMKIKQYAIEIVKACDKI